MRRCDSLNSQTTKIARPTELPRQGTMTLVLGGVRSGKSQFAQSLALQLGGEQVLFIATANPGDAEMQRRIAMHCQSRPKAWQTLETPLISNIRYEALQPDAISPAGVHPSVVVVDCVTLLISNIVCSTAGDCDGDSVCSRWESDVAREIQSLCDMAMRHAIHLIIVSGEVGLGLVPESQLGRAFRDLLGFANQRLSSFADASYFMIAGHPVPVHALSTNVMDVAQQLQRAIARDEHAA